MDGQWAVVVTALGTAFLSGALPAWLQFWREGRARKDDQRLRDEAAAAETQRERQAARLEVLDAAAQLMTHNMKASADSYGRAMDRLLNALQRVAVIDPDPEVVAVADEWISDATKGQTSDFAARFRQAVRKD